MRTLLLILMLSIPLAGLAEMYRWVDEKGDVQFSDRPPSKDTEPYVPPEVNTTPPLKGPAISPAKKSEKKPFKYESIKIANPAHDQVFLPDTTSVTISVEIKPGLNTQEEDKIIFSINGTQVQEGPSSSHTIKELTRGSHTVNAAIVNKKGKKLISAEPVTFHVIRPHL